MNDLDIIWTLLLSPTSFTCTNRFSIIINSAVEVKLCLPTSQNSYSWEGFSTPGKRTPEGKNPLFHSPLVQYSWNIGSNIFRNIGLNISHSQLFCIFGNSPHWDQLNLLSYRWPQQIHQSYRLARVYKFFATKMPYFWNSGLKTQYLQTLVLFICICIYLYLIFWLIVYISKVQLSVSKLVILQAHLRMLSGLVLSVLSIENLFYR